MSIDSEMINQHAEGRRARLGDAPLTDCPYPQDTEDYLEWCAGWHGILNAD
jgi:hypothetical protein